MMESKTNATTNAIEIACGIERRGIGLYRRASMMAADDESRELFLRMMEEERQHLRYFESLRDCGDADQSDETTVSLASALASEAYLPGGLMQMAYEGAFTSREAMLDSMIQAENDSIVYYEQLIKQIIEQLAQPASGDEDGQWSKTLNQRRDQLSNILEQERAHLAELHGWR
ncbi:MAG: hypothetical protein LBK46_10485 [Oscillospiraceae bacterium]|nr:hypothetical protein [Oscillospiraceae bacterium]